MGITVVVGGQYGSEGKGKVAAHLAKEFKMSIRTGGPNAGHTIRDNGHLYKMRSVPCAFINPECVLGIGAGAVFAPEILLEEIRACGIRKGQLYVDPNAAIIEERHRIAEGELMKRISSTAEGVGTATSEKALRAEQLKTASSISALREWLGDVAGIANEIIDSGRNVFLEGTQGFWLSLHHGRYPYVTSRDTTPGCLCSDAGLSPRLVDEIIMVVRTWPIRVGGPSGPFAEAETTWEVVEKESGSKTAIREFTTVTNRLRRVARFSMEEIKRAAMIMRPTQIALNHVDQLNSEDKGKTAFKDLSRKSKQFISDIEAETGVRVSLIGTGERARDIIDIREGVLA